MCIGEAPGAQEDLQGKPFVGRSGKLLRKMLASIGLNEEEDYYIANIIKHRPPNNRPPEDEEIGQCIKFLKKQIEIIHPRILLLLGRTAVKGLLPEYQSKTIDSLREMSKIYGSVRFEGTPVLVTYHPSAVLRFPAHGQKALVDFRFLEALKREFDEIDPLL